MTVIKNMYIIYTQNISQKYAPINFVCVARDVYNAKSLVEENNQSFLDDEYNDVIWYYKAIPIYD